MYPSLVSMPPRTQGQPQTHLGLLTALRHPGSWCLSSLQIVPALQEIAALKRGRDLLQKQVVQLQQQLSASENAAQTAATAAAAERARSNKSLAKTRQQLTAAVQRLHHMADREQQQQVALQEVSLAKDLARNRVC